MIPPRNAAGDLHIEQTLGHAVAPRHFAQHHPKRGARHGHGKLDFAQGSFQARQVQILINEAAIEQMHHLINAIAELIAAIFDIHRRIGLRHIAAIHISDA